MKLLLSAGADVNAQGGDYGNALDAAIIKGRTNLAETLLAEGADVNVHIGPYGNALELAASNDDERTVQLLLDAGADIERVGRFGKPVSAAFIGGALNIVRSFLETGCDMSTFKVDVEQWLDLGPKLCDDYAPSQAIERLFARPWEAIPTLLKSANQWLADDANNRRPPLIVEFEDNERQMRTYMERACIHLEKMMEADEWDEDEYDARSSTELWCYSDSDPECEEESWWRAVWRKEQEAKKRAAWREGQRAKDRVDRIPNEIKP